jgi:DNA-binding GntR family transcriptional regulator
MSHRQHMELNARFHQELVTLSNNRLMINLYRGIQIQLLGAWVQRGTVEWRARLPTETSEHHAILDAIVQGDRIAAREAARAHIQRSLDGAIADLLKQQKKQPAAASDQNQHGRT